VQAQSKNSGTTEEYPSRERIAEFRHGLSAKRARITVRNGVRPTIRSARTCKPARARPSTADHIRRFRDALEHRHARGAALCRVRARSSSSRAWRSRGLPTARTSVRRSSTARAAARSAISVGKAAVVLQNGSNPVYVVYQDAGGACVGINALTGLGRTTITGSAYYWDSSTGSKVTCNLDLSGNEVQFAVMGTGPFQCPLVTDQSYLDGITDVTGPISAYTRSSPTVDAAVDQLGGVLPRLRLRSGRRHRAAGTTRTPATTSTATRTRPRRSSSRSRRACRSRSTSASTREQQQLRRVRDGARRRRAGHRVRAARTSPDASRSSVRAGLAGQGQNAGYWPDSSATAFDKSERPQRAVRALEPDPLLRAARARPRAASRIPTSGRSSATSR
jgi:hypothetical protein